MNDSQARSPKPQQRPLRLIFDANALITACKFSWEGSPLIDVLLAHCDIRIPQSVAEEATRNLRHPDARLAAQRLSDGSLASEEPSFPAPAFLSAYRLGQGEIDAIRLYLSRPEAWDALVTDDLRTHLVCIRMGIPVLILPDLIVELVRRGRLTTDQALRIIETTRSRYSEGIVAHTRAKLSELTPKPKPEEEAAQTQGTRERDPEPQKGDEGHAEGQGASP